MKQTFYIRGMHCKKCKAKVVSSFLSVPGLESIRVDIESGKTIVVAPTFLEKDVLKERITLAGAKYSLAERAPNPLIVLWKKIKKYAPLLIALTVVTVWTILHQALSPSWNLHNAMHDFMAGFFLVFGGLKVFNWNTFAQGFQGYDPLAMRSELYAYAYPAIEIALGLAYGFHLQPEIVINAATVLVLSITSVGIVRVLSRGEEVQCACLGGFFNIPISWLTVFENALMIFMAIYMQIAYGNI